MSRVCFEIVMWDRRARGEICCIETSKHCLPPLDSCHTQVLSKRRRRGHLMFSVPSGLIVDESKQGWVMQTQGGVGVCEGVG